MEDKFSMSSKDLARLRVIQQIEEGAISVTTGSQKLGISTRQLRRILARYRIEGTQGLLSRRRGGSSNNRTPDRIREHIVTLITEHYSDFGPTLAAEKLLERHGIRISRETVRTLLIASGHWQPRQKKVGRIHQRRTRRPMSGELLQGDASFHDWFEGRGPRCVLLALIDDATSEVTAQFVPTESCWGYLNLIRGYIERQGIPEALYTDKHSTFWVNIAEARSGTGKTQVGRVLQELEIHHICAHSPQAKGRIERAFGTLQDRLVRELRLAQISTIDEANQFLEHYLPKHNQRFSVSPRHPNDAHRDLDSSLDLDQVFTIQHQRKITKNLEVSYNGQIYQILEDHRRYRLCGQPVTVLEAQDGKVSLRYGHEILRSRRYGEQNPPAPVFDSKELELYLDRWLKRPPQHRPKKNHPWRSARI